MLAELDVAASTAQAIDAGQAGVLRLNFVGSALLSVVPGTVQRFRRARPGVEVEVRERSTVEQLRALGAGVVDVALVRPPIEPDPALRMETVMRERTIAAIPEAHPLAKPAPGAAAPPRRRAARALPPPAGPRLPRSADRPPGRHRGHPHVVQYAPEMLTIIGLVAAGIGVSPVPASVAGLTLPGVEYRPLSGAPDTELVAVTRAEDESALVDAFVAEARAGGG